MRANNTAFILGWLALTAAGASALVAPPWSERSMLLRETRALTDELAKPTDGPEVVERLTNDLDRLREFGRGRMTPIPTDSDVAGLMGLISTMLTELSLDKRDITTRPAKSLGDASSMPVTIILNGPFTSVYEAIDRIESMPRLVRVERLRITSETEKNGMPSREGTVRAELSIDAFYTAKSSDKGASIKSGGAS